MQKWGLLRETDLFAGLSDDDIMAIGHATTMTRRSAASAYYFGPTTHRIHILKKGKVRVYRVTPRAAAHARHSTTGAPSSVT